MKQILLLGGCGFIGSALDTHLRYNGFTTQSVDLEWRGDAGNPDNIREDYVNLSPSFLADYPVIILLAAHSTVAACQEDPEGAVENNLINPIKLMRKLDGQKFIYASSGSVLSSGKFSCVYDVTKKSLEDVARNLYPESIGLRFGTVCGPSPNNRRTVLNAMVEDGIKAGSVTIINGESRRPILGMTDLCRSVGRIINSPTVAIDVEPGIYNLCSFNSSIEKLGSSVAKALDCQVIMKDGSEGYDFTMGSPWWASARQSMQDIIDSLVTEFRHG